MPRTNFFPFPRQAFGSFNRMQREQDDTSSTSVPPSLLPSVLSRPAQQGPGTSLSPLVPGSPALQGQGPIFQGDIASTLNPLLQQLLESSAGAGMSVSGAQNALLNALLNSLQGGF